MKIIIKKDERTISETKREAHFQKLFLGPTRSIQLAPKDVVSNVVCLEENDSNAQYSVPSVERTVCIAYSVQSS